MERKPRTVSPTAMKRTGKELAQAVEDLSRSSALAPKRIFYGSSIPEKKLRNAMKGYAKSAITTEKALLLVDDTLLGSGSAGILLTDGVLYASLQASWGGSMVKSRMPIESIVAVHVDVGSVMSPVFINGEKVGALGQTGPGESELLRNVFAKLWPDGSRRDLPEAPQSDSLKEAEEPAVAADTTAARPQPAASAAEMAPDEAARMLGVDADVDARSVELAFEVRDQDLQLRLEAATSVLQQGVWIAAGAA